MKEKWIDIPNFEGIYMVSNMGRVKRLTYDRVHYNGGIQHVPERILKSKKKDFFCVNLKNGSYKQHWSVNRLVYSVFNNIKLRRNHLIIHKNGNKLDCSLENLKVITKRNFVSSQVDNKTGFTGVSGPDKDGQYKAAICFETKQIDLYSSKNKEDCHKIYQLAKKCIEQYERERTLLISSFTPNRLINKSVKIIP